MKKKRRILSVLLLVSLFLGGCFLTPNPDINHTSNNTAPILNTTVEEVVSNETTVQTNERVVQSVVSVFTYDNTYKLLGTGSGVVVSEDEEYAYLFTNNHVINEGKKFEVAFSNKVRVRAYLATTGSFDLKEDVAVLKVLKNDNYLIATLGDSSLLKVGQQVLAIGSPLGYNYANTLTMGIISGLNVKVDSDSNDDNVKNTMYMIQVDAALNPGNSGGALFSSTGLLIGINTLKIIKTDSGGDVESFNFSIPINHFAHVANILLTTGSYTRPKLGIVVIDISAMNLEDRDQRGIEIATGVYIQEVLPLGPSRFALSAGRVISEINKIEIENTNDFSVELYKNSPGDEVEITTVNKTGSNKMFHSVVLGS